MADLEAALRPHVESGEIPGLVALVARGDDVRVMTLGTQGTSGRPMERGSIFRAASITKPLTAALTMILIDDGALDLDAPVSDLLPELAEPRVLRTLDSALDDTVPCARPITTRHLLTSTAGHGFATFESAVVPLLMEQLGQASMEMNDVPAPDEWMRRLAGIPLMHQPGDGWTYNASYDVLGVLLARASGTSLADLMAERLLDPLGMVDTGFHVPADKRDRFTTLYGRDEKGGLKVSDEPDGQFATAPAFASGAGGLVTTADDWLAFGRMLLAEGEGLLEPESVRQMMTDQITTQHREMGGFFLDGQGWGFGGGVDTEVRTPWNVVGRYGWVGGTGTAGYVDPRHGVVTVILTQVELGGPESGRVLETFWTAAAEQRAFRNPVAPVARAGGSSTQERVVGGPMSALPRPELAPGPHRDAQRCPPRPPPPRRLALPARARPRHRRLSHHGLQDLLRPDPPDLGRPRARRGGPRRRHSRVPRPLAGRLHALRPAESAHGPDRRPQDGAHRRTPPPRDRHRPAPRHRRGRHGQDDPGRGGGLGR